MSTENEAAREARAKRLRADIDAVTGKQPAATAEQPPETPREFIHRRMREIEEEKKRQSGKEL